MNLDQNNLHKLTNQHLINNNICKKKTINNIQIFLTFKLKEKNLKQ
jgi:hypothetical protein